MKMTRKKDYRDNKLHLHKVKKDLYFFDWGKYEIKYYKFPYQIRKDSYISMDYALVLYNIIKIKDFYKTKIFNSVTNNKHNVYINKFWKFFYSHIQNDLYTDFRYNSKLWINIAIQNKALFDFFYFKINEFSLLKKDMELIDNKLNNTDENIFLLNENVKKIGLYFEDLKMNYSLNLTWINFEKIFEFCEKTKNKKVLYLFKLLNYFNKKFMNKEDNKIK